MDKSKGHIFFAGDFEFFARDGQVMRAPTNACIMPDGFRCGRWECSLDHWDRIGRDCVCRAFGIAA